MSWRCILLLNNVQFHADRSVKRQRFGGNRSCTFEWYFASSSWAELEGEGVAD